MSLQEEGDSALIIDTLESILRPLQPYEDIPSNVIEYQQLLMKTYYKVASYDRVVSLAEAVMQGVDDVDAAQEAEIFNVLAVSLDDQEGVALILRKRLVRSLMEKVEPITTLCRSKMEAKGI